ncbi:hypothetical protein [Sphingomonas sp.]|jgi:hypothetical protein|uniref:hypothetical protein n=1 Tax=Sphingomonas sp. TaxID=28214 RepID=UPI002DF1436F|nr:hypothetical protein [Sphingomonas sp.]
MQDYRLYCLRADGRIKDRHDYQASDDDAALAQAVICPDGFGAEIWQGPRRLASLTGNRQRA